nr:Ger(x)C family spore germination C-terminal domain-containing protein [bacterium]
MKNIKKALCLLLILMLAGLTGCWDAVSLGNITYPLVIGIDYLPDTRSIQATAMYFRYYQSEQSPPAISHAQGEVLGIALQRLAASSDNRWLAGLLQSLMVNEEMARQGIAQLMDLVLRDAQIPMIFELCICQDNAGQIMSNYLTDADQLWQLRQMLSRRKPQQVFPSTNFYDFARDVMTKGCNPIVPVIAPMDEELDVVGLGIFRKDTLEQIIGLDDSITLSLLRQEDAHSFVPYRCSVDGIAIRGSAFIQTGRTVTVRREGDALQFTLHLKVTANVIELVCQDASMTVQRARHAIAQALADDIKQRCDAFLTNMAATWQLDCVDAMRFAVAKWPDLADRCEEKDFIAACTYTSAPTVYMRDTGETR